MTVAVFLGPTFPPEKARTVLHAEYLPPAAHGDLFRVARRDPPPRIIGIVDGYFQSVPAVRHKEILWAMSRGVHVFGAGSIGALRAAELHDFGMVGVGKIFEAYRDGLIEDDDEVAVEHGPVAVDYVPLCEPMVSIRATLGQALREGAIGPSTRSVLISLAKSTFYKQRSYDGLLQAGRTAGLPAGELAAFRAWLPSGRIDQKRDDTLVLLKTLQEFAASNPKPFEPPFRFEEAEIWQADMDVALAKVRDGDHVHSATREAILDEVRLIPGEYAKLRREALTLGLAMRALRDDGRSISDEDRRMAIRNLRNDLAISDRRAFEAWLSGNHLSEGDFARLVDKEAALHRIMDIAEPLIDRHLIDALRLNGRYEQLARRAARKDAVVGDTDASDGENSQGMPVFQLILWFFAHRVGSDPPHDPDRYALDFGFADVDAFHRALWREYVLWRDEIEPGPPS